jgi:peptidoglycan/xylan/chitin deacetylase (PgdA/CDA1 family)
LQTGSLPPRAVSITFDDGYANNVELAYPVLARDGFPATIFLSTAYMQTGELFPFIKLRLIRSFVSSTELPGNPVPNYKSTPLDGVLAGMRTGWETAAPRVPVSCFRALRPLSVDEIRSMDPNLVAFGGHTHTHCILGNESTVRRESEIKRCTANIARWTDRPVRLFSYPNGQRGDYGDFDKQVLRREGIQIAVTGIAGTTRSDSDFLECRRYPIGMHHDEDGFCAEVTGFRTAALTATMRSH